MWSLCVVRHSGHRVSAYPSICGAEYIFITDMSIDDYGLSDSLLVLLGDP
jgi:hypothetical protein